MTSTAARDAQALTFAQIQEKFSPVFPVERDPQDHWNTTVVVPAAHIVSVATFLRETPALRYDVLPDVLGVDYLNYPNHSGPRFAVVYLFKSTVFPAARFQLKVRLDEEDMQVPTLTSLYAIADWMERETYDQFGVQFVGHPNLRRLLNHHEFVGHPLRKDYPAQKRQWLSTNDPMVDQLEARLKGKGYQLVDPIPASSPDMEEILKGSRQ